MNNSTITSFGVASISLLFAFAGPLTVLAAGPASVNLGTAGNFVILAKTGISTTGSTKVTGDIGVSPAAATYMTGFALTLPAAGAFSTSALVTGKIYSPSYADPTPANLTTAVLDMQTAYTDAAGRASTVTEFGAGNIGGLTLAPGVYKWGTGVTIPTDVTLTGSANDVWIFQIAQTLTVSSAAKITLAGGAQASNIFWVVAGQTTIGTTAVFSGNILDQTAVVLNTGATLNGRALAQTAVTLDSNAVTIPAAGAQASVVPPPPTASATSTATTTTATSATSSSTTNTTSGSSQASTQTSQNTSSSAQASGGTQTASTAAQSTQSASTDAQVAALRVQINGLLLTLQSLQQARQSSSTSATGQTIRTIAVNLVQGSRDTNVAILQQFLTSQNKGPAAQALSKVSTTGYFGSMTRAALAEFQASVGINPALGNFGAITRAYVSAHY